jgi:LysR family cyn operon transcriptional activator
VQLVEDGVVRLRHRLQTGDVQLATIAATDEPFMVRPLYPVYGVALWSKTHRLGQRRAIDVLELADEPLLLLNRNFASREWLDAACSVGHIRPRVLLESGAPHTIIALAAEGYGIGVVPSTAAIRDVRVRAAPLIQRGMAIGRWLAVGWNADRFLPRYATQFADELAAYCRRTHPGREFLRRAPPLPAPKEPIARAANALP